jgi:ABC-2 type transport system ATP-binding protein
VLLTGDPLVVMNELQGQVWSRAIAKDQLPALQEEQQVISSRLYAGQTIVHVVSDGSPGPDYEPVVPSLEDVYFARIAQAERAKVTA